MPFDPAEAATEERSVLALQPFGKYFLVQKLAEGGMAEIFLAKQTGDGPHQPRAIAGFERNVVIKRMLPHLSRQPHFVDMFLDEARLAARLVHPNIIPIYDVGLADDSYYICMEYLPGADLAWVLRQAALRHTQLPLAVALRIVADAARGLHYAHEFADEEGRPLHIVHRDVSPSNIYLSFEGQVKLLDFGIAKAESRVTSTGTGTVKGKQMYMAPEQSRAEPVDRRSDIYSLGVTLYEALTVSRPFLRDTVEGILAAALSGDFEPPRRKRPEIPVEVEAVVCRAMAREAGERYATCAELADALEAVLATMTPGGAQVGRYLRELCGEAVVAQKTRVPSLQSLQRGGGSDRTPPRPPSNPSLFTEALPGARRRRRWQRPALALGVLAAFSIGALVGLRPRKPAPPPAPPGCAQRFGAGDGDAIVIGAALPLSVEGKPEDAQVQLLNAMRLALDEINQRDGVAGRRFALQVCDNGGDVNRLRPQLHWLVDWARVPAIVTSWSSQTLAAVSVTVPRGVLTITADATSPELAAVPASDEHGTRLLWRTAPSDATQGRAMAGVLARDPEVAGAKRVGIVYQDDPYGQGLAGVVAARLPQLEPGVDVRAIQYPFRGDVTSAVAQLAAFRPDLTVLIGFPLDGVRILNLAAASATLTRHGGNRWFFADGMKETMLFARLDRPEEIEGALGIEPAAGQGPEAASFQSRFRARFLREAENQSYAANRYDAVYLLALASAWALGRDGRGALTGARMAEGLRHLSSGPPFSLTPGAFTAAKAMVQRGESIDVEGASGKLDFDAATGEARAPFALWRVHGRGFVPARRVTPIE